MKPLDDPTDLHGLLRDWQASCDPGPGFNRSVWSRIEAEESCRGDGVTAWFFWVALFARPRFAVTAAAMALFGGMFLGGLQARTAQEEQYLRSLHPYAARAHQP